MAWRDQIPEIRHVAADLGLRVRDVEFHEVTAHELYALAAGRLPGMYHHWSFGRNYELERARHDQGRATLHELVVNLDPAQAFLLDHNSDAEQVFVCAHVMGHVDLFGRNAFCLQQRGDMDRVLAAARRRFADYEREHGEGAVESVIDAAHTVMWHSTPVRPSDPRPAEDPRPDPYRALFPEARPSAQDETERYEHDRDRRRRDIGERDLLRFVMAQAPLEPWQRDVLAVVRETALYLLPQIRVKVLHEGWASFWHRRILRAVRSLPESDVQDARMHGAVAGSPGRGDNPYWLGLLILEHLERRGENLPALVREESDRSLLERLDERMVDDDPHLRAAAARIARTDGRGGGANPRRNAALAGGGSHPQPPWRRLRDALVASLPRLPEVEVWVEDWDTRRLTLGSAAALDPDYARAVLTALGRLWGGEARVLGPDQDLSSRPTAASGGGRGS